MLLYSFIILWVEVPWLFRRRGGWDISSAPNQAGRLSLVLDGGVTQWMGVGFGWAGRRGIGVAGLLSFILESETYFTYT
jgi:hypothetical protein